MIKIIKSISDFFLIRESKKYSDASVGFVPTMGALHKGHMALINKSKEENEITVVSIFVNPTQFNDKSDYENYPITLTEDLEKLEKTEVDFLIIPEYSEMYSDNYKYSISENNLSLDLCGAHRPGHFNGVLTIVMKLLNIVKANNAYFGEKDYQQYLLIKGMAEALFLETEIILVKTVRDTDGLALSSRNKRLSEHQRKKAVLFPQLLKSKKNCDDVILELKKNGFDVDYIKEIGNRRFGAVTLGNVRLIDNVEK